MSKTQSSNPIWPKRAQLTKKGPNFFPFLYWSSSLSPTALPTCPSLPFFSSPLSITQLAHLIPHLLAAHFTSYNSNAHISSPLKSLNPNTLPFLYKIPKKIRTKDCFFLQGLAFSEKGRNIQKKKFKAVES